MDETVSTTRAMRLWPFAFVLFPSGIMQAFLLIVFPYLGERNGLSLAVIGSIVGLGMSTVPLKMLWTPVVDLWLSFRLWIVLSIVASAVLLAILLLIPPIPANALLIAVLVFSGMAAATFSSIAASGMMALAIHHDQIGRASGYFQGGALTAQGVGGGIMLWSATHLGVWPTLAIGVLLISTGLLALLVPEPSRAHLVEPFLRRVRTIGRDFWQVASSRRGLYVALAFATPIGAGCASNIWAGFAHEWGAGPSVVALTTGLGFGLASALGSFLYGFCADKLDRVTSFLLAALLLIGAAVVLAVVPRTPVAFAIGALVYGLMLGCSFTAFTALSFDVIGKGAAASKMGVLNAIGNLPNVYMSPLLGWVHDRWSVGAMLWFEALFTLIFVAVFALLRVAMRLLPDRSSSRLSIGGAIPEGAG